MENRRDVYLGYRKVGSDINGFLSTIIGLYADRGELGILRNDPFIMRSSADLPARAPDILFLKTENFARRRENYLDGPVDLVIEIVSKGSERTDKVDKRGEYETGGVAEYWLIDPLHQTVTFFLLSDDGLYAAVLLDEQGRYYSPALPGFWIDPKWLWEKPTPNVWGILAQWGELNTEV